MNNPNLADLIVVDVPIEEYKKDVAQGLQDDEVLQPGRHTFRRGGFLARHNIELGQEAAAQKHILLNLDSDVALYFEERANDSRTIQAHINHVLRKVMELEQGLAKE